MNPTEEKPVSTEKRIGPIGLKALKDELSRFEPVKRCRMCQLVFGFSLLLFLVALTFFLFARKGVPPIAVIPVDSIQRDKPISRTQEAAIMGELRGLSQAYKTNTQKESTEDYRHVPKKKIPVVIITP